MTQYLDTHSRQLLKKENITVPQVLCLDELRAKGATSVAILATRLHSSASTTVGIVDRLQERGLVKRSRDTADRRLVFVEITDKGRDFLASTPHLLHNRLHEMISSLDKTEQSTLADSLERLAGLLFPAESNG